MELAVEQVNGRGGLLGRKVELVTRDDKTAPDQGIVAYNQIKGEIDALIGPVFSNSALAIEPLAQRDKMPYLSLAPAQEQVEPIKSYVFVTPALSSMYAERYLQYIQAAGHQDGGGRLGLQERLLGVRARGHGRAGAQVRRARSPWTRRTRPRTSDFSPLFTHVRESGGRGAGLLGLRRARRHRRQAVRRLRAEDAAVPDRLPGEQAVAGADGRGRRGHDRAERHRGGRRAPARRQAEEGHRADGHARTSRSTATAPPQFAQDGYSASLLLFEAIRKAGSTDKTKIQQALESMDLVTPNGRFRYSPTDHSGLSPEFISVNTVKDGQFVPTDWAKEQLAKTVAGGVAGAGGHRGLALLRRRLRRPRRHAGRRRRRGVRRSSGPTARASPRCSTSSPAI